MTFFKSIALAFSMFSVLPMPSADWNEKNMRYMMCAFPLVGVIIAILCAVWFLFGIKILFIWQKSMLLSVFALGFTLIPIFVTGGIHIDGFMDTCDALASHADREKKFAILKDSHVGAFAVLGCVLYILSYFVLSYELCDYFFGASSAHRFANFFSRFMDFLPVLSIFVLSRLLSAFAVATFPIAKNSGLVHTFATASAKIFTAIFCGFFFILISLILILFWQIDGAILVVSIFAVFGWYFFMARWNFGGITGDTAGWFVQMCEIFGLGAYIIEKALN